MLIHIEEGLRLASYNTVMRLQNEIKVYDIHAGHINAILKERGKYEVIQKKH